MRLFDNLLPHDVSSAVAQPHMWETSLPAQEEQYIARAGGKRKREFRAGRHCARAALAALGGPGDAVIGVGEKRRPLWPEGFAGSISHTRGHCVAVAGRREQYRSLGIDIEQAVPLSEDIVRMICTGTERRRLSSCREPLHQAKLIFSIKEAIYKAHNPLCGVFFGFQDAEVRLDIEAGSFAAVVNREGDDLNFTTSGRFAADRQLVAAFVAVLAG